MSHENKFTIPFSFEPYLILISCLKVNFTEEGSLPCFAFEFYIKVNKSACV